MESTTVGGRRRRPRGGSRGGRGAQSGVRKLSVCHTDNPSAGTPCVSPGFLPIQEIAAIVLPAPCPQMGIQKSEENLLCGNGAPENPMGILMETRSDLGAQMGEILGDYGRPWPPVPARGRPWKWPEVAGSGRWWPEVAGSGREWPEVAGSCRESTAVAGSGREWPEVVGNMNYV